MINFLRSLVAPAQKQPDSGLDGRMIDTLLPGAILDGVSYLQPFPVPAHVRENPKKLKAFTEALSVFHTQHGTPYGTGGPFQELSSSMVDPLAEWDDTARKYVLEQCHLAWERNPLANAAVAYNRLFAIGSGFTETFRNGAVRDILTAFIEAPENNIRNLDGELCDTLQVDGEIFIRKFFAAGGQLIAPLRAWGVRYVITNPDNPAEVAAYSYSITLNDGSGANITSHYEDIPADEVVHVTINKLAYERRGRPDLFRILPWLRGYKEWLETRGRVNYYRSLIAWDVTFNNSTASQIAGRMASIRKPPSPGSINAHSDKEIWSLVNPTIGAADSAEDGRQLKLMAAAGMRLPEYFLSDGANANLASATQQSLPALRSFGDYQRVMRNLWIAVFKDVVAYNVAAGNLPEEVEEERSDGTATGETILAVEAFDVQYPTLESSDPANAIQAIMAALSAGLISEETATSLLPWPVDPYEEKQKIGNEAAQKLKDIAAGRGFAPVQASPFGGGMFGQPQESDNQEQSE